MCTGPEAGPCLALAETGAESGSEAAHVHCWLATRPLARMGTRAYPPCAQCWEEPGLEVGLPQGVLSCANAAGCSATKKGFVSRWKALRSPAVEPPAEICSPTGLITNPFPLQSTL